jgi:hypothetical protein
MPTANRLHDQSERIDELTTGRPQALVVLMRQHIDFVSPTRLFVTFPQRRAHSLLSLKGFQPPLRRLYSTGEVERRARHVHRADDAWNDFVV